jgi:hypothetical protein
MKRYNTSTHSIKEYIVLGQLDGSEMQNRSNIPTAVSFLPLSSFDSFPLCLRHFYRSRFSTACVISTTYLHFIFGANISMVQNGQNSDKN